MVNVSKMVQMLLDRMDKFPDEFVNAHGSPLMHSVNQVLMDVRWETINAAMLSSVVDTRGLFTAEEVNAYRSKIMAILRKRYEEAICEELVNPRQEQGELFGAIAGGGAGGTTPLTVNQITNEALKIIEQELYKNNKPTKLII
jgi:hypothetical protein